MSIEPQSQPIRREPSGSGAIRFRAPRKRRPRKKYVCICKVGEKQDGTADCIKHHCDDLLKYTAFLDKAFPGWRWFNVYSNVSPDTGEQRGSFTKYNRPMSSTV